VYKHICVCAHLVHRLWTCTVDCVQICTHTVRLSLVWSVNYKDNVHVRANYRSYNYTNDRDGITHGMHPICGTLRARYSNAEYAAATRNTNYSITRVGKASQLISSKIICCVWSSSCLVLRSKMTWSKSLELVYCRLSNQAVTSDLLEDLGFLVILTLTPGGGVIGLPSESMENAR
jgi:hypothetical protein